MPSENGKSANVAQLIRDFRKDNPRASNKKVAEALTNDKFNVSPRYVAQIRRAKPGKQRKKKKRAAQKNNKRTRQTKAFPAATFEDSLVLAIAIQKHAPAGRIRRVTLFDELKKSPDSEPSRQLITNSNKYGMKSTPGKESEHVFFSLVPISPTSGVIRARPRAVPKKHCT